MTEAAGSSFTDLLLNQPILVWSLAGGISILLLAGFLSIFLSVRSRRQKANAKRVTAVDEDPIEAEFIQSAVSELQTIAEKEEADSDNSRGPSRPPIETVNLGADNESDPDAANFVQTGAADDASGAAVVQEEQAYESRSEGSFEEQSDLAALFEADVIVDPHLQSLRDNLPDVKLEDLVAEIHSISAQLRERINSARIPS